MRPHTLSFPGLAPARARVAEVLAQVGRRSDAASVLGVGPAVAEEVARNLHLEEAPALAARELYTGVLYDALDLASLDPSSARRATRRLVVVSALYGAVRPTDRLAPYRLSMGVSLPGIGPLASFWRPRLTPELDQAAGRGLVVDCRSSTYGAAWVPGGDLARRWVRVRVPGASHGAKHTRGLVARALCASAGDPRRPEALRGVLGDAFDVELHDPGRSGRPWVLDAVARQD